MSGWHMSSIHKSNILQRMFFSLIEKASEKLDSTQQDSSGCIQPDVVYDIEHAPLKKILHALEQRAAKQQGYFQFEGLQSEPTTKNEESVSGLVGKIFGILFVSAIMTVSCLGIAYEVLVGAGLSGFGLGFALAVLGVFSFMVNMYIPFKELIHKRVPKSTLGSTQKVKNHLKIFYRKGGAKEPETEEEERYFTYDLYAENTNEIIKTILKDGKLPRIEELEAWLDGYPDELKAQVWLTYNCFATAKNRGLRDIILLNQFGVRAALYELLEENKIFAEKVMEACKQQYIPLDVFSEVRKTIFSWLEKKGGSINRSGFVRDYFYGDKQCWKKMSVRSKYYAFSELCDDLPVQASYIAIYQMLRQMHYASRHVEELTAKNNLPGDQSKKRELFIEIAKKMFRRNDWQQRKSLNNLWQKGVPALLMNAMTFINALMANSITVMAVGAGTITALASFFSGSEIFFSMLLGASAFFSSILSIRPVVKKQIASISNMWSIIMREECGRSKLIADSFRCDWDQIAGLLIATGMAVATALFTMMHAQGMIKYQKNKALAFLVQTFFTSFAPWLQPFYVPLIGVVSFFVAFFFYSRIAQFYRVQKLGQLNLAWRGIGGGRKRQNGVVVFWSCLSVLASVVQTWVVYACVTSYLAVSWVAVNGIALCTFFTVYALNQKASIGLRSALSDLYNGYFYQAKSHDTNKESLCKLFLKESRGLQRQMSTVLGTPKSASRLGKGRAFFQGEKSKGSGVKDAGFLGDLNHGQQDTDSSGMEDEGSLSGLDKRQQYLEDLGLDDEDFFSDLNQGQQYEEIGRDSKGYFLGDLNENQQAVTEELEVVSGVQSRKERQQQGAQREGVVNVWKLNQRDGDVRLSLSPRGVRFGEEEMGGNFALPASARRGGRRPPTAIHFPITDIGEGKGLGKNSRVARHEMDAARQSKVYAIFQQLKQTTVVESVYSRGGNAKSHSLLNRQSETYANAGSDNNNPDCQKRGEGRNDGSETPRTRAKRV